MKREKGECGAWEIMLERERKEGMEERGSIYTEDLWGAMLCAYVLLINTNNGNEKTKSQKAHVTCPS